MRRLFILCTLLFFLNGCTTLLVSGVAQGGMAVVENRSIGRKVDDTVLYTSLTNTFIQADQAALLGQVTFNIRYARVMLTGNVKSEEDAAKAVALAWKVKGVSEVINELVVNPEAGFIDTASDALAKRNLEGRLLITKDVWVINYSIDVTGGAAYFIGRVKDKAELERVLNVARSTKGIKRVVSHLQISTDTERPTAAPASAGNGSAAPSNEASDVYTGPVYHNAPAAAPTSRGIAADEPISSAPLAAPKAAAPAAKMKVQEEDPKEPVGGGY